MPIQAGYQTEKAKPKQLLSKLDSNNSVEKSLAKHQITSNSVVNPAERQLRAKSKMPEKLYLG